MLRGTSRGRALVLDVSLDSADASVPDVDAVCSLFNVVAVLLVLALLLTLFFPLLLLAFAGPLPDEALPVLLLGGLDLEESLKF